MLGSVSKQTLSYIVLGCILVAGIGLRLVGVGDPVWLDESISLLQAQPSLSESITLLQEDVHVPLYTLILNVWIGLFGDGVWTVRALSILFAVLTMISMYVLGRTFFDETTGLYATAFFAASEMFIHYGQEIRPYSLFVLFTVLSFYFYLSSVRRGKHIVWYTGVNVLLCYTHPFALFAIASQCLHYGLILMKESSFSLSRNMLVSYLVTGLAFAPWLPTLLQQTQDSSLSWIDPVSLSSVASSYLAYISYGGVAVLAILLAYHGFPWLKTQSLMSRNDGVLLAWFVIPSALLILGSVVVRPMFHRRYLLFTIPALYFLIARLLRLIPNRVMERVGAMSFTALLLLTPVVGGDLERDNWEAISSYLDEHRGADEPIVIQPYYHQQPLSYYYTPSCFNASNVFSCNKETERVESVTKHNCCAPEAVTDSQLRYHLPSAPYWLVLVRDAPIGDQILTYEESRGRVEQLESFPRNIRLYYVTGSRSVKNQS